MRNLFYTIFLLVLFSCDNWGSYTFKAKNETSKNVELRFYYETSQYSSSKEYGQTIKLSEGEEKIIRIVDAPLNSPAHDCLKEHGMTYFDELVFDTYVDSVKIERQLWQPENWIYEKNSKWSADYTLIITDELIDVNE
jgi:hypothetical protein